jgi:hypothetical protein
MSLLTKKERAVDLAKASVDGDSRCRTVGIREPSAPVVEADPISSWLNNAIKLTFASLCDSVAAMDSSLVLSMSASSAQYLK